MNFLFIFSFFRILACICSSHFEDSCFEMPLKYRLLSYVPAKNSRILKADALPTLHLPNKKEYSFEERDKRSRRVDSRRDRRDVHKMLEEAVILESDTGTSSNKPVEMNAEVLNDVNKMSDSVQVLNA